MKKLLEEEIEVVVELWLSLDVLSFKPAWRPGQQQNSLILALTLLSREILSECEGKVDGKFSSDYVERSKRSQLWTHRSFLMQHTSHENKRNPGFKT